jgi:hypothetical protein
MFHIMRNSTIFGTRDLVDRFMTALHSVAPRGVENYVSLPLWEQRVGNRRVDARVEWVLDGRPYNLDLEIRLGTPNATDLPKPYEQLPRDARSIPVFVSPYLSPGTRARLEDLGWSYWDATGNMLLFCREPFITIRSTGASRDPSPSAEPRPLATLKGRSTSAVMVHLLTYGGAASVRDLARETKIGLGTVSRVVALLREENFLQPKGGGSIALANRVDVARRWAEDYRFETTYRAKRYYSRLGDKAAVDRIKISGIDYAFTGLRAAAASFALREQVAPLPASDVWVYTDDVAALVREADLAPDPRRGTIWLAESDVIGTGQEGLVGNSAEKYVLPWRAVGDLLSTPGRHAAVGEELARLLAQERAPYGSQ